MLIENRGEAYGRTLTALCFLAACSPAFGAQRREAVPATVARLCAREATYDDWRPILDIGKPAVAELRKLLANPSQRVRAHAAVLLYRLGDAKALDTLSALLESKDPEARAEAAAALQAFIGEPTHFDPAAPEPQRAKALAQWRAWWQRNRDKALARPPMKALYGRILAIHPASGLVALSLTGRHGARRGMELTARRGTQPVCQLEVVAAPVDGAVARVVELSARTPPEVGDHVFAILR